MIQKTGIHTIPANWVIVIGPTFTELMDKLQNHAHGQKSQKLIGIYSEQTNITQGNITTRWVAIFEKSLKPGRSID